MMLLAKIEHRCKDWAFQAVKKKVTQKALVESHCLQRTNKTRYEFLNNVKIEPSLSSYAMNTNIYLNKKSSTRVEDDRTCWFGRLLKQVLVQILIEMACCLWVFCTSVYLSGAGVL